MLLDIVLLLCMMLGVMQTWVAFLHASTEAAPLCILFVACCLYKLKDLAEGLNMLDSRMPEALLQRRRGGGGRGVKIVLRRQPRAVSGYRGSRMTPQTSLSEQWDSCTTANVNLYTAVNDKQQPSQ